jgi:hypothetical protein
MKTHPDYISFLLRLWQVSDEGNSEPNAIKAVWRASLENPHTGERKGFASLEELFDFLRTQTEATTKCAKATPFQKQSSADLAD